MKRFEKLEAQGWEQVAYEYDGSAQREAEKLRTDGYEAKLVRERTDTPGVKMFSVWKREA